MGTNYADGGEIHGPGTLPINNPRAYLAQEWGYVHEDVVTRKLRQAWLPGANWAHPGIVIEADDNAYKEATA